MTKLLLDVRNLKVNFKSESGEIEAVRDVSFDIKRGETVGIVGESGSGKSVSALSILRLLNYPTASHPSGEIRFQPEGEGSLDLLNAPEDELRTIRGNRISMIFQEPLSSLNPLHTVEKQIGEVLELHRGADRATARSKSIELLAKVGINDAEGRLRSYPHQLSGGQRQRVMIAMALANEPDLLIADEPTTALDVTVQAQILKLLRDLQSEMGMAILLITHDLGVIRKVADRVCVMTNGEMVEKGSCDQIFQSPQHGYTRHLLGSVPKDRRPPHDSKASSLVTADDLRVWFPIREGILRRTVGHFKAVDGVNLSLREGQTVGVVGESGSGKTTLGRALLRLIPSSGAVSFASERIDAKSWRELRPLRSKAQIVFQDPYGSLNPRLTVAQIVTEGLNVHERLNKSQVTDRQSLRQMAATMLDEVGLGEDALDKYPHEFSGGERQRISIARAMILRPKFVVLDEPTSALDVSIQSQVLDLLSDLQDKFGLTYLFISHDLKVIRAIANDVVVMKDGVLVESGETEEIFNKPKTEYTKSLIAAALDVTTVH